MFEFIDDLTDEEKEYTTGSVITRKYTAGSIINRNEEGCVGLLFSVAVSFGCTSFLTVGEKLLCFGLMPVKYVCFR